MFRFFKWIFLLIGVFFIVSFLLGVVVAVISVRTPKNSILYVTLDGEMSEGPTTDPWAIFADQKRPSLYTLTRSLRRAAYDDNILGVVLDIKSPSLSLAQVQAIDAAMADFRKVGKWNLAFLETAGEVGNGSMLYALAACTDKIVMTPAGDLNLVGLGTRLPFLKGTLSKFKIQAEVYKRHEYKNTPDMFTESQMTPVHREALAKVIDDLQNELSKHIASRRDLDFAAAQALVAGGPYLGPKSLALGLIDKLGYWDEVLAEAAKVTGRDDPLLSLTDYAAPDEFESGPGELGVIFIEGDIMRGESSPPDQTGSDSIAEAFRTARDNMLKGVLVRINSPGGSYVASDLIRREVAITREAGIPVVASMSDMAASGGYFVAMNADRIFAEPASVTGSIGVFAVNLNFREFLNSFLGVSFDGYDATPNAGIFSSIDPPSAAARRHLNESVDRVYADFVGKVAADRKLELSAVDRVARGRVWSGAAAKELGLVDELGDFAAALSALKELAGFKATDDIALEILPEPEGVFDMIEKAITEGIRVNRAMTRFSIMMRSLFDPGVNQKLLRWPEV